MSDRGRVWRLRHAEAEHVAPGTAGAGPIALLTERGRRRALAAVQRLAA